MAAYIIFIRQRTHTPSELEIYSRKAPASLTGHPITFRALYGHHEVIEGADIEGAAVLEFPSFDEAKRWYDSPAYRDARQHRLRGADYIGVIVEGLSSKR
jgi:uncharacterized protein (DUF1330 family)